MSGGKTKMSAILHGFVLLTSAMFIPQILNMIPLASLAAILFMVGYKLAKPALFKSMYKIGWSDFIPFMVTIIAIVATDLLVGIGIGMAVAIFYVLYNNYKKPFTFEKDKHFDERGDFTITLSEEVTFLNKANIQRALNILPEHSTVTIDASNSMSIHHDVIEIIEEFKINAVERGITVNFIASKTKQLNSSPVATLEKTIKAYKRAPSLAS
jgi:MFS superfamily sulfate permease-like transporter